MVGIDLEMFEEDTDIFWDQGHCQAGFTAVLTHVSNCDVR